MAPRDKDQSKAERPAKSTITEVARLAGVSTSTAGRVLGGYGYSSPEKKQRVLEAARSLGYRPNMLARSLITGRTKTIGVVAGDIQSPFYASILRGISNVTEAHGFGLLITNSDETLDHEIRAVELLMEKRVDGLIISPCDTMKAGHLRATADSTPMVLVDREVEGLSIDSVGIDNEAAARDCIGRLIRAGHRRIGVVAELEQSQYGTVDAFIAHVRNGRETSRGLYPSWQRLKGYLAALDEAGIAIQADLIRRVGRYSAAAAVDQVRDLISRDRPSAIFTADGLMSEGAMLAIRESGLSIPGDLSLVCFDDLEWMQFVPPGLDALAQPRRRMGEAAARLLLQRIDGGEAEPTRLRLPTRYIGRGSIGPPAAA